MKRIKTNIIELHRLFEEPWQNWREEFRDGKLDVHKVFYEYREDYDRLYTYSRYDLIGWEIENNCFDWNKNSLYVAKYHPELIDNDKYNWEYHGWAVAMYCPEKLVPELYNRQEHSEEIARY